MRAAGVWNCVARQVVRLLLLACLALCGCAKTQQRPSTTHLVAGDRFQDCSMCPTMIVVPAGSFLMGSPWDEEGPPHVVTIPHPFAVGVYEVTRGEWRAYRIGAGRGVIPDSCPYSSYQEWQCRHPMETSWGEAQSYVDWLSLVTRQRYRLLSEAEWEYVARAGTTTQYHTGSIISTAQANHYRNYAPGHPGTYGWEAPRRGYYGTTESVGSFAANAFGLHDVHGNVWEWVRDCWNASYVGAPVDGSAWEEGNCALRILRGGDYYSEPRQLRSAYRGRTLALAHIPLSARGRLREDRRHVNGFRVARAVVP